MAKAKRVLRIDMDTKERRVFPSLGAAALASFCAKTTVARHCNGQTPGLVGKYRFIWAGDTDE